MKVLFARYRDSKLAAGVNFFLTDVPSSRGLWGVLQACLSPSLVYLLLSVPVTPEAEGPEPDKLLTCDA
jgi:hypothetical protein